MTKFLSKDIKSELQPWKIAFSSTEYIFPWVCDRMVSTISEDEIRILFNVDNLSVPDSTAKQLFDLAVVHGQKVKRKLNYLKISLVIVRVSQRSRDYFTDVSGFGELRFRRILYLASLSFSISMLRTAVENINFLSIRNLSSCFMFDWWTVENGLHMESLKTLDHWTLPSNLPGLGFECCHVSS